MTSLQDALRNVGSVNASSVKPTKQNVQEITSAPVSAKRGFVFSAPKVPKIGDILQDPKEREKALKEFEEFKTAIDEQMPAFVYNRRLIEAMEEREAELYEATHRDLQNGIADMLSYDNSSARNVATLAYAKAMVATCPTERWEVVNLLDDLVRVGFLTITPASGRGVVRVYSKNYTASNNFARNADEVNSILTGIEDLVRRTVEVGKARFEADLAKLKVDVGENPLTVTELKAGKPGRILLEVPDQPAKDNGKMYKGGWLLLESRSKRISVVNSAGAIQRKADEMVGAFLYVDQIGAERLHITPPLKLDAFNLVLILWKWVSAACQVKASAEALAVAKAKALELANADRSALASKATLTSKEFFLEAKTGTVVFDFGIGKVFVWKTKDEKGIFKEIPVREVVALVERNDQGQVCVADCPDRLKVFFADHREFEEPGDKFSRLGKFGALMRIGFAIASAEAKASSPALSVSTDDVTSEIAKAMGVDPSTLNLPPAN